MPSIAAASSCECPYSPTSTSTWRAPAGRPAMAASRSSMAPSVSRPTGPAAPRPPRPPSTSAPSSLAAPAALRQHGVDRDAVQPGAEGAAALERRQAAPGLDEGLLGAVLGGGGVGSHAQAESVDRGRRGCDTAPRTRPASRASRSRRAHAPRPPVAPARTPTRPPASANPHLGAVTTLVRVILHSPSGPRAPEDRPLES